MSSPQQQTSHTLEVQFTNLTSNKGLLFVKIVDEKENEISAKTLPIKNQQVIWALQLPPGKYAVSCFHDEDNNGKLTTNLFGIPQERYGFSNNARGKFGPPPLKDQLFQVDGDTSTSITLN
jgi:uncharacterized protein (DUF2141 family)